MRRLLLLAIAALLLIAVVWLTAGRKPGAETNPRPETAGTAAPPTPARAATVDETQRPAVQRRPLEGHSMPPGGEVLPERDDRLLGGAVRAPDGAPIAQARVGLYPVISASRRALAQPLAQTQSDADGSFVIPLLAPGEYVLAAIPDVVVFEPKTLRLGPETQLLGISWSRK